MSEIFFYHLELRPLEQVLPILLEKTIERGLKAIVQTSNIANEQILSDILWSYREDSFLAHLAVSNSDNFALSEQPILITSQKHNPNRADFRFFVDGSEFFVSEEYKRHIYLFDGHNSEAVLTAREEWKKLAKNHDLTYWQQDNSGIWHKKS